MRSFPFTNSSPPCFLIIFFYLKAQALILTITRQSSYVELTKGIEDSSSIVKLEKKMLIIRSKSISTIISLSINMILDKIMSGTMVKCKGVNK